jgi:predicted aldo/keto reductase-like oxidoreductase
MEVHRLGRTELQVKRIGFGGMTIPQVSLEQAVAALNRALDLGVNFVDTAMAYGDSQAKIGEVMRTRRGECYLSSRSTQMDYQGMKRDVAASLEALKTDHLDLYEAHDVSTPRKYEALLSPDGALKALKEAKLDGGIGHIGFTSHNWELTRKLIATDEFEAALITYNLADHTAAESVIPLAEAYDVGLFVMKVFGNGQLLKLRPIDDERYPTIEESLRFALANQHLPLILTGVKSPEEISENVAIAQDRARLTHSQLAELRAFGERLGRGYCYGCNYCMPCPEGIDIPGILRLLEQRERMSWDWPQVKAAYRRFERTAADCVDCGQCEEKCPQHIPIRERLQEAERQLGGRRYEHV